MAVMSLFICGLIYTRVTDEPGLHTNMASKHRCREKLALGNIEDYCNCNLTFPWLLPSLIWPEARGAATADGHDVGVFLAH